MTKIEPIDQAGGQQANPEKWNLKILLFVYIPFLVTHKISSMSSLFSENSLELKTEGTYKTFLLLLVGIKFP